MNEKSVAEHSCYTARISVLVISALREGGFGRIKFIDLFQTTLEGNIWKS
jgi:hypothetical protein